MWSAVTQLTVGSTFFFEISNNIDSFHIQVEIATYSTRLQVKSQDCENPKSKCYVCTVHMRWTTMWDNFHTPRSYPWGSSLASSHWPQFWFRTNFYTLERPDLCRYTTYWPLVCFIMSGGLNFCSAKIINDVSSINCEKMLDFCLFLAILAHIQISGWLWCQGPHMGTPLGTLTVLSF